jgi:hypothetical protein
MAPGHEVVIRAVGTALAGLSMAFAIYMLAYGAGRTRINGMEHLAIFAQPRGDGGLVRGPTSRPTAVAPQVDMAATGSLAASAGKAESPVRPVEIVAARADRVWLKIDGAILAAAPGDSVAGLGRIGAIVARDGGAASDGGERRERRRALHAQEDLRVIASSASLPFPVAAKRARRGSAAPLKARWARLQPSGEPASRRLSRPCALRYARAHEPSCRLNPCEASQ